MHIKTSINFKLGCLALAISQSIAMPADAQVASIVVNTNADVQAENICTLRAAIISANTNQAIDGCASGGIGIDVIEFDNTLLNSTITLNENLPTIDSDLTINGLGQDKLTISGGGNHALFDISNTNVTLNNLCLVDSNTINRAGGAVNADGSTVVINNSKLSGNYSFGYGGGVSAYRSSVTISNSIISANSTNASGGGISANYSSVVTINDSELSGNFANANGGGVSSYSSSYRNERSSSITINNSTLSTNSANGFGGAAFTNNTSVVTINESMLSNNSASDGGGISSFSFSVLTVNDSTLSGNSANGFGGGVSTFESTVTLNSSTLTENSSSSSGGGVFTDYYSFITIDNSTLSGNSANGFGGGVYSSYNSFITINSSTLSGNSAENGGGIFADISFLETPVTITNSIISGNLSSSNFDELSIPNDSATKNNVIGTSASTLPQALFGFTPDPTDTLATSDRLNLSLNQIIQPLADNGGPTLTHYLAEGSPAIDAGNNTCFANDQRGEVRANSPEVFCDIGSVEDVRSQDNFFVIPLPDDKTVILGLLNRPE